MDDNIKQFINWINNKHSLKLRSKSPEGEYKYYKRFWRYNTLSESQFIHNQFANYNVKQFIEWVEHKWEVNGRPYSGFDKNNKCVDFKFTTIVKGFMRLRLWNYYKNQLIQKNNS